MPARKRLAQEETKLAEQREKSKEKKVGKPFCQWREGESILQDQLFSICCVLSGTVYKTHPWFGVEKLWIFARIATWHLNVDEASKKSKGAKAEEDEELS